MLYPIMRWMIRRIVTAVAAAGMTLVLGGGAIGATGSGAVAVAPRRIMSINMCSDLILLMLVPKARIASVTDLAHPAVAALMPGADAGVATNHGAAEEILRDKPDLILGSAWTGPVVRRLARAVGAKVVDVDEANSFDDIRRVVRSIGDAVGARPRADGLVAAMDRELADLARAAPTRRLRVVAWSGGGTVPGRGTLTNAIITAAGATNIAATHDDGRYSSFGLEELLTARPDLILQGVGSYDQPSLHRDAARHPLIARLYAGRQIDYPDTAYSCGLPQSARAAAELRAAMARTQVRPAW